MKRGDKLQEGQTFFVRRLYVGSLTTCYRRKTVKPPRLEEPAAHGGAKRVAVSPLSALKGGRNMPREFRGGGGGAHTQRRKRASHAGTVRGRHTRKAK